MKKIIAFLFLSSSVFLYSQDLKDVLYTSNTDEYAQERCKLDVYNINKSKKLKPAFVWFHGGGITGGDKSKIFIGGHSAGGYLSGMVGFAPKYLQKHNIKNTDLAGMILLSAQVTKHFRIRKDCGDKTNQYIPQIDELSILGNVKNKIAPLCIIVGDRRLEWKCRVEENFFLEATVRTLKTSPYTEIFELQGTNHGTCDEALTSIARSFIKKITQKK